MKRILTLIAWASTALALHAQGAPDDSTRVSIGYSSGNQRTMAGAIEKLGEKRMSKGLIISPLDALSGQAAGVQEQTLGHQEEMVSAVRVRGTTSLTGGNDPLVIIDGVTSNLATLSTIYPADIESFTILKDAAETSQYGSRGAAGVIEVATKKGRSGQFHVSYEAGISFEAISKNIEMLSGNEFRNTARSLGIDIIDGGLSTNFQDAISRTGLVHNNHISFGGGTEASNYRASIGMTDHQTVIKTNRYRNYIAKLDISQKAFDNRVTFDLGIFGSIQKNRLLPSQWKLFYSAATFNPTLPAGRNSDGEYETVPEALWISNPTALIDMQEDEENAHFNAHLKAKVDVGYGVTMTAFGSYSYYMGNDAHYYPTYVWSHGEAYRANMRNEGILGNVTIDKRFDITSSQHISLLAMAEIQSQLMKGFNVTTTSFTTDAYGYENISAGAVSPWEGIDSYREDAHLESFMLRGKYTIKDRYSLTMNARLDGSSKVGRNNHWGFFPSAAAAWIVSDEKWMKPLTWLSLMKVRAGYGRSGNLGGINSYNSMQLIQPNGVVNVDGTVVATLGIIRNANPDLKWEVKRTLNVGLDLGFWKQRIMLTIDAYKSWTSDMLYMYDVPVPPYPYDKLLANIGKMQNQGLEIGFGITPLQTRDTELNINVNMAFERNKLVSLDGDFNGQYLTTGKMKGIASVAGAGFHGGSDITMQIVGEQLGMFYLPHCNGLIKQADGSYRYDVSSEKQICGQATPKMKLGSNVALRYRHWDISVQMNGAFGHKIFNGTALTYMNMRMLPNYNVMKEAPAQNIKDQTISDYWLERGDYLNIDYVNLGWNVPVKSKYIQQLRLSAAVNNLATITGYSGLTPMINSSVVNSTLGVDDKNSFPVYRSYSMAVSLKF